MIEIIGIIIFNRTKIFILSKKVVLKHLHSNYNELRKTYIYNNYNELKKAYIQHIYRNYNELRKD